MHDCTNLKLFFKEPECIEVSLMPGQIFATSCLNTPHASSVFITHQINRLHLQSVNDTELMI